jgi:hypothetical protein
MRRNDSGRRGDGDEGRLESRLKLAGHVTTAEVPVAGGGGRKYPRARNSPGFGPHAARKLASV